MHIIFQNVNNYIISYNNITFYNLLLFKKKFLKVLMNITFCFY